MKTTVACLEWLTLLGRKDKLKAACSKRLWFWKSEIYHNGICTSFGHELKKHQQLNNTWERSRR